MGKAMLFILVAVAAGLAVYLIAAPRFIHPHASAPPEAGGTAPPSAPPQSLPADQTRPAPQSPREQASTDVNSAPAVAVPESGEQRSREELEAKRGPLYTWIRDNLQKYLVGWQPSTADPATLDLYLARNSPDDESFCMARLVQPYAAHYGFNHVSFYAPNPPSNVQHWRLDSESTPGDDGVWQLFKK